MVLTKLSTIEHIPSFIGNKFTRLVSSHYWHESNMRVSISFSSNQFRARMVNQQFAVSTATKSNM